MISLVLGLIIGGLSVMFALQNVFPVTVTFLSWQITSSVALIIALSVLAGLIIGALISIPGAISNALTVSGLKKDIRNLRDDLGVAEQKTQQTMIIKDHTPVGRVVVTEV
jgi:uncharacterized integral membrane protein